MATQASGDERKPLVEKQQINGARKQVYFE
jgi:hypothetical protein